MFLDDAVLSQFIILPTQISNFKFQIKSNHFFGLRSSKDYYKRPGVVWVYGKGHWGVSFCVDQCVLREWVVGRSGLGGYFGEQGLPPGIQECLQRFRRGCVDYISRQFVPKWSSPNGEGKLATARTASLLVEFECVALDGLDRRRWTPWGIPGDHG